VFDTGGVSVPADPEAPDERVAAVARLRSLVARTRPVVTADQRLLPVLPGLEDLFVDGGLRRGSLVGVGGSAGATSLALAVAAGATRAGSWVACVGGQATGWAAAQELGVELERLVVVRTPETARASVTAALVDAFDVVLCTLERSPSHGEARRLRARARERGAVLVALERHPRAWGVAPQRWPEEPDVSIRVVGGEWTGLGAGSGLLRARHLEVEVRGRRGSSHARRVELLLPGPDGHPARAGNPVGHRRPSGDPRSATVAPLRRVG
jgi:hypothetical protein